VRRTPTEMRRYIIQADPAILVTARSHETTLARRLVGPDPTAIDREAVATKVRIGGSPGKLPKIDGAPFCTSPQGGREQERPNG